MFRELGRFRRVRCGFDGARWVGVLDTLGSDIIFALVMFVCGRMRGLGRGLYKFAGI